ncbi:hypothetical protein [Flavobacterium sp.]|uniref:hypothetical protein n=1 Tax=Flavobacterium sp. TaxID=239 RepID=UPI001B48F355|nr:hypothetical protein [Flavobacterium sp.]MBP6183059.1 hypothetical protein [Flavobacterium sp.]
MTPWTTSIICYIGLALVSFVPVVIAMLKKVKLHPGGETFSESPYFSDSNKKLLQQHFTRLHGTLVFWKNKAEWHKRFHYYTLIWTIPVSILIPIITQTVDTTFEPKLFLTIISTHTALLIAFHRALKIENNFKAFRHGESEFYDLYRRLLDRPVSFGSTEEKQIETYFIEVENIRRAVRIAETDNLPMIDDNKKRN